MLERLRRAIGGALVSYLTTDSRHYRSFSTHDTDKLVQILRPADIILVEGNQRISGAIKYLTQSTWSHAAVYIGENLPSKYLPSGTPAVIEADLGSGVAAAPLEKYSSFNIRICRAHALSAEDQASVVDYMVASLGMRYDLKNIIDLARYLLPQPPVPRRFRRRMLALGSGDPTRAVCSSLIAQAFQLVRYPILPHIERHCDDQQQLIEILHIRHHSLFAPRDFDLSPYFRIIKPVLHENFDYRTMRWQTEDAAPADEPIADGLLTNFHTS